MTTFRVSMKRVVVAEWQFEVVATSEEEALTLVKHGEVDPISQRIITTEDFEDTDVFKVLEMPVL